MCCDKVAYLGLNSELYHCLLVERINDADGKVISGGFCKEREREKGCKLELEKGYISVVV